MTTSTVPPQEECERALSDAARLLESAPEPEAAQAGEIVRSLAETCANRVRAAGEAVKARDHVLGVVAHDLRNPLNTIVTSTDLLLQLPMDEARRTHHLEVILRSAMRMDRLIQDLLDVAWLEGARLNLRWELIAAGDIARDAADMHETRAAAKSQTLSCTPGMELPLIRADRHRLMQAISNLLDNAIKFTPAGGSIDICCTAAGDCVRYSVSDTGPGIPAGDLPGLFASFWQGRRSRSGGTGLGLAIARGVVEAHGGTISAENRREGGARFTFTIPAATRPGEAAERIASNEVTS